MYRAVVNKSQIRIEFYFSILSFQYIATKLKLTIKNIDFYFLILNRTINNKSFSETPRLEAFSSTHLFHLIQLCGKIIRLTRLDWIHLKYELRNQTRPYYG